MTWKPDGYPDLSPYLIVDDAEATLAFIRELFGAEQLRRYDTPEGRIMHVELRIGESVVMMGEAGGEWPPVTANLHVYVEDVDATYRRALELGAEAVRAPERTGDDPDRRGGFRDPGGNTWWVATQQ